MNGKTCDKCGAEKPVKKCIVLITEPVAEIDVEVCDDCFKHLCDKYGNILDKPLSS